MRSVACALQTVLVLAAVPLVGCRAEHPERLAIVVDEAGTAPWEAFVSTIGDTRLSVGAGDDDALAIRLVAAETCAGCYSVTLDGNDVRVEGDAPLGLAYGLTDVLERQGYRFPHPQHSHLPPVLQWEVALPDGQVQPEVSLRGLHLHTLHPIEAMFDLWTPQPTALDDATRLFDWIVRNRGNQVQWTGLDDIVDAPTLWREHTAALLDAAHSRGLDVALGVQLFGASNLQLAYDLSDANVGGAELEAAVRDRLSLILDGLPWDRLSLSFGEFFGADPGDFIAAIDTVWRVMQELSPGIGATSTIHVGNYEDLRVTWEGEEMLYYFLAQFADPGIVPWIHTVMYYNLFEDAGGAYLHDEFDEHRAFLLDRMAAGLPHGYHPETAYWVAFDNSVPTWLPLYVRSRHLDLQRIAETAGRPVEEHVLFSTGWEWGYWLQDAVSLRQSYTLSSDWQEPIRFFYDPIAPALSELVIRTVDAEHEHLLVGRLAGWMAGRDSVMELGDSLGIWSQPDRPSYAEIAAFEEADRLAFVTNTTEGLERFTAVLEGIAADAEAQAATLDSPFAAEVRDGAVINTLRARFAASLQRAVLALADGRSGEDELAEAERRLEAARVVVDRRHAALWDPDPAVLLERVDNPTVYDFGYLHQADELCYWVRELMQAQEVVRGVDLVPPGCAL